MPYRAMHSCETGEDAGSNSLHDPLAGACSIFALRLASYAKCVVGMPTLLEGVFFC